MPDHGCWLALLRPLSKRASELSWKTIGDVLRRTELRGNKISCLLVLTQVFPRKGSDFELNTVQLQATELPV